MHAPAHVHRLPMHVCNSYIMHICICRGSMVTQLIENPGLVNNYVLVLCTWSHIHVKV